jgi:flagellar L-ring protein precursor FlgH
MTVRIHVLAAALAAGLAAAPARAQDPAAAQPTRQPRASWTSDGRTLQPGEGLTVLLDEYTLATADRSSSGHSDRSSDADLSVSQDVVRNPAVPRSAGAGFGSGRRVSSRESGESLGHHRFVGEITVRVVALEGGRMKVEGKKRVQIDRGWQEVALTGWVSPGDVGTGDLVESRRVGDLRLTYTSKGGPSQGLVSRILGLVWP